MIYLGAPIPGNLHIIVLTPELQGMVFGNGQEQRPFVQKQLGRDGDGGPPAQTVFICNNIQ